MVISFLTVVSLNNDWQMKIPLSMLTVLNFIVMQVLVQLTKLEQQERNEDKLLQNPNACKDSSTQQPFQCPLVPLLPSLGVVLNFVLCTRGVSLQMWIVFFGFELVGAMFYLVYGYNNSLMPYKVHRHSIKNSLNYSRTPI